jgi:transcription termination/antitermination protein NusG
VSHVTHLGEASLILLWNRLMAYETETTRSNLLVMPELLSVPRWYAAYTFPRHEKVVSEQLKQKSIETYLPLFERQSRWKDRIARVQLPLFPSYVFLKIPLKDRLRVFQISGILRLVGFQGHPTPLEEGEIEALRNYLSYRRAEPHPYVAIGKRVRVSAGPLAGVEGVVVRRKGKMRIIVSIDSIQRSVALDLEAADVRSIA